MLEKQLTKKLHKPAKTNVAKDNLTHIPMHMKISDAMHGCPIIMTRSPRISLAQLVNRSALLRYNPSLGIFLGGGPVRLDLPSISSGGGFFSLFFFRSREFVSRVVVFGCVHRYKVVVKR